MKKFLLTTIIAIVTIGVFSQTNLTPMYFNAQSDEDPKEFINMGGYTYFIGYLNFKGYELCKSNGTPAGTTLVKEIHPGVKSGLAATTQGNTKFVELNNELYFFANDSIHGFELWKSDGTAGGTTLVKDIYPGTSSSCINIGTTMRTAIGKTSQYVYFFARDSAGSSKYGLWRSNGTDTGTVFLKTATTADYQMFADGNLLYFNANLGGTGDELCVSDGTPSGTQTLKDINSGSASSSPGGFAKLGSNVLFAATGANGRELYITNGTAIGTTELKDINAYGNSDPSAFSLFNGNLIFFANDSTHGNEAWVTDGTSGGTQLLLDITAGAASTGATRFMVHNGKAFFMNSIANKLQYWVTDGTPGGTYQFLNNHHHPTSATSVFYVPFAGRLYFIARPNNGSSSAREVWSTTNGLDTVRHTKGLILQQLHAGVNVLYTVAYIIVWEQYFLYTVDLANCPAKVNITGNATLTCNAHQTTLSVPNSYTFYTWSTGDSTAQINVNTPGTYIVNVQDTTLGCSSADTITVTMASSIITPQICGVTVDSATGKNMIVWNKHYDNISETYFIIFKEIGINQFAAIADVPFDSLSAYIDTSSNPLVNSEKYRLLLLDSCGKTSSPSITHTTIHLSKNIGIGGEINLLWNAYSGTSYSQVNVLRSVNGGAWSNIATLSGSVVSYSDLTPPSGSLNYRIEVLIDSTCTPSRAAFTLKSNTISVLVSGVEEIAGATLILAPNPASTTLRIEVPQGMQSGSVLISDITGKTIRSIAFDAPVIFEDISALASGTYLVSHSSAMFKPKYFLKH